MMAKSFKLYDFLCCRNIIADIIVSATTVV